MTEDLPLPLARTFNRLLGQPLHPPQGDLGLLAQRAVGHRIQVEDTAAPEAG
jgi:hypothetical protein